MGAGPGRNDGRVTAHEGINTLCGYVETYAAKLAAERAARKVLGVKGIANELDVRLTHERIDPDIAHDALEALKARVDVPRGLGVTVRDGYVTLTGEVEWMFQQQAVEKAVKYLRGVRGVSNQITTKPGISTEDSGHTRCSRATITLLMPIPRASARADDR